MTDRALYDRQCDRKCDRAKQRKSLLHNDVTEYDRSIHPRTRERTNAMSARMRLKHYHVAISRVENTCHIRSYGHKSIKTEHYVKSTGHICGHIQNVAVTFWKTAL